MPPGPRAATSFRPRDFHPGLLACGLRLRWSTQLKPGTVVKSIASVEVARGGSYYCSVAL